jgi:general secretion pathway protein G
MNMKRPPSSSRRVRGMTLIELIIVVVLIGLVAAAVGSKVISNKKRAEAKLAVTQLSSLATQIDQYQTDVGSYPDSLDALLAAPSDADGWLGPYAKKTDFLDPWQNPIQYAKPGQEGNPFALTSLGADRKTGGEGVDKDITAP